MNVIQTEGLTKDFPGGIRAVDRLDLGVDRGEIFGFLGPNGAGKTTTVRLLNGTLTPTGGRSVVLELESDGEGVRRRTSTLAELSQMYEHLSVWDNLVFFAEMYEIPGNDARARITDLLRGMELWDKKDLKLGTFSTGMKKKAALARTLLNRPEIIFLDEPTSGLDPDVAQQVTRLIHKLAKESGTTIFLCTHNLPLAEGICDTFGFISNGKLVATGKKEEMIDAVIQQKTVRIATTAGDETFPIRGVEDINGVIQQVLAQGRQIVEVGMVRPTLEQVYFHYIGRRDDELA